MTDRVILWTVALTCECGHECSWMGAQMDVWVVCQGCKKGYKIEGYIHVKTKRTGVHA